MLMVDQMIMTSYYINLDSLLVRIKQTQKRTWLLSTIIHSSWSHHWPCTWSISHIPCQFQIQICHLEFQICLGRENNQLKVYCKMWSCITARALSVPSSGYPPNINGNLSPRWLIFSQAFEKVSPLVTCNVAFLCKISILFSK